VDPGTSSGAAVRSSFAASGGVASLIGGKGAASPGSSAGTAQDAGGRSMGESDADSQTQGRFAQSMSQLSGGLTTAGNAMAAGVSGASNIGADVLGSAGVGHQGPYLGPTGGISGGPGAGSSYGTRGGPGAGAQSPATPGQGATEGGELGQLPTPPPPPMQPPSVQPPQMQPLPGGSPGSPGAVGGVGAATGPAAGAAGAAGAAEAVPVLLL
jgi:hypothetical protein